MNPEIEQAVREKIGIGDIPAPMMAELASILAFCEMAHKAIERAIDMSVTFEWTPSVVLLTKADANIITVGETCRDMLIVISRIGAERESQKEMES